VQSKAANGSSLNSNGFNRVLPNDVVQNNDTSVDNIDTGFVDNISTMDVPFEKLRNIRTGAPRNIILGHININSVRHKFSELKVILCECLLDILIISEVKLDETFSSELFNIDGFCVYRLDYSARSGGILIYVRDSIANTKGEIEICEHMLQCLTIKLMVDKSRYTLIAMYKNPKCPDVLFEKHFEDIYNSVIQSGTETILVGDLNFNMQQTDCFLHDMCDRYDLTNLVTEPTCFKSEIPTLIDVILVSNRRLFMKTFVCDVHLSDFHFMVGCVMRKFRPAPRVKYKYIRNFKRVDYDAVRTDIKLMDIMSRIQVEENPSIKYSILQECLVTTINKHAPKIKIKVVGKELPRISKELRKAILKRNMCRNKFFKRRCNTTFVEYRKWRNKVNDIKRKENRLFFKDKCTGGPKNVNFWKTVKPYFNKQGNVKQNIMLYEGNTIRTDTTQICEIFNDYFVQIGCEIEDTEPVFKDVQEIFSYYENCNAIMNVRSNLGRNASFNFKNISEKEVIDVIGKLKVNKAPGIDELPPIFLKAIVNEIAPLMTHIINECIWQHVFPEDMKLSNITPLFKKKDSLCKENYRSVNVLTCMSKIFERILYNQQYEYFAAIFHPLVSGFRTGYSCSSMLLKLTEDIRKALDQGYCVGLTAMDLSKAFDVIPRGMFIAKLKAYGYEDSACQMMFSYLSERKQRVKIDNCTSRWVTPVKGVPQGSILGPLVFNIFMNDFLCLNFKSSIYNYADDNTLALIGPTFELVKHKLEFDTKQAVKWFNDNKMKANPDKFQVMFMGKDVPASFELQICESRVMSSSKIEILGIILDSKLKFDSAIKEMCRRASRQINVLQRLKSKLDKDSRMAAYNAFIMSTLTYCQIVWMHCGKVNINKLEKVHERALRFVNNDFESEYDIQLRNAGKNRLLTQRIINMGVEVFKAKKGLSPQYVQDMFTNEVCVYNLRAIDTICLPKYHTKTYGFRSFCYLGAKLWNNVTNNERGAPTLPCFIDRIKTWSKQSLDVNQYV